MTDRELLEKAARAAGIDHAEWVSATRYHGEGLEILDYVGSDIWNPFENDGDAFRLSIKCSMDIEHFEGFQEIHVHSYNSDVSGREVITIHDVDDINAEVRRAIVRAAAAMEDNQ